MGKLRKACTIAVKSILFVLIFCLILYMIMCVLLFKQEDGTLPMRNYYDLPEDTVDVLFLGSSHIGMNVSTQVLWDEYGIAGYKCWGSTQPIWNTYYYLKECLEYQTPKVVVVDVHGAIFSYDYADYVLQIKNTMGMRFSMNKIEAVMASAPQDSWADLLLELPTFHTRYNELQEKDFEYFPWNTHSELRVLTNEGSDLVFAFDIIPPETTEGVEPLAAKEEDYLRRIIALCREKQVPLELIAAPYQISEFEQRRFRGVAALAEEYEGLRFTNFNEIYADVGIDSHSDFLDTGHFNKVGVPKYTRALANLLQSRYELPDRRTDPNHIWNSQTTEISAPVYALQTQFAGDGKQNYIDTGYQLYDNPLSSWTLISEFEVPPFEDEDQVIFSCYDERVNEYYGLLVNMDSNQLLTVRFSSYEDTQTDRLSPGQKVRLAVVKNHTTMTVYCDGELLSSYELSSPSKYSGNLLIGCQQAADGTLFRYSRPKVYDLQVFDAVLSEAQINAWQPNDLPNPPEKVYLSASDANNERMYALDALFQGDAQEKIVDTGVLLYADPDASWTLLSRIDPRIEYGDTVYYACFLEDMNDYHGLLVRRVDVDQLNIVYGRSSSVTAAIPTDREFSLIVMKDRSAYTIYLDGEKVADGVSSPCGSYDGPLMIGCELDAEGKPFRYSGTKVCNLEIISGLLREDDLKSWAPAPLPEAPAPISSPVDYRMESGLAGDGRKMYLDTGVQLYDTADKNWWIHMVLDLDGASTGTALACFAEDPANYRGLLVRHIGENTYGLTLGAGYCTVTASAGRTAVMDVVKEQYHYKVYMNGELRAELDSRTKTWDGTLFVGAERMLDGTPFRFSTEKIRKLTISGTLPSEDDLRAQMQADMDGRYFVK